jgi:hypothetical protein
MSGHYVSADVGRLLKLANALCCESRTADSDGSRCG